MSFLNPSIYFINLRILWIILRQNVISTPHLPRIIFTLAFLVLFIIISTVNIIFRCLDEMLFWGYRSKTLPAPLLIISNPRSGTSYLQRLMLAQGKWHDIKMYQTIFPSISIFYIVKYIGTIDQIIGRPVERIISFISERIFKGWQDIHPTGINSSEEDEGLWFLSLGSPALCLLTPFFDGITELTIFDKLDKGLKKQYLSFYYNSILRIQYCRGFDKPLLIKSVMGSGRVLSYLHLFPKANLIVIERDKSRTVPSFVSMFSATWSLHSSDISDKAVYYENLEHCPRQYDSYLNSLKPILKENKTIYLEYEQFVRYPRETIDRINTKFDITNVDFTLVDEQIIAASKYKSKHQYPT